MTQASAPARPVTEDYSADVFEGVAVNLFELFKANLIKTGQPMIRDKQFTDCMIEGPAVLLPLAGVDFDGCNLGFGGDDPRSLILMPMAKNRVVGAIGVENCKFRGCDFFAVGYTGPDSFIDQLLQVLDPSGAKRDA